MKNDIYYKTKLLSVDAWRGGDGWTWNNWQTIEDGIYLHESVLNSSRKLLKFCREKLEILTADSKGKVQIDGQDIKKIQLNSVRKYISLVSQDIFLFDDTIKKNVSYANPDASQKEIEMACKFAAADEFINKLPERYETRVGENGVKLSGGQKQRISIVRALINQPKVILADEPTGSLDHENTKIVFNSIRKLSKEHKIITVFATHNLNLVKLLDKCFLMEGGKLIDFKNK